METLDLPFYQPSRVFRGGHLQTLATLRRQRLPMLSPIQHVVKLSDGDAIVLHEDCWQGDRPERYGHDDPSVLLVHGLCGCHAAGYMIRLADRLSRAGFRTFRMDMRGCGEASGLCDRVTHAGRSDDCLAAMNFMADQTSGPMGVVGFSMGGNQVLRMLGRFEGGTEPAAAWKSRLVAAAAVAPPVDLARCSGNMLVGSRRIYSRYFLKQLISRLPPRIARQDFVRETLRDRGPKTLWELDDVLTAPLSGFAGAAEYYATASAMNVTEQIKTPTLVLAAADDPIVPVACFRGHDADQFSKQVRLHLVDRGGHLGYVDRRGRCWMDAALERYFVVQTGVGSISSETGVP